MGVLLLDPRGGLGSQHSEGTCIWVATGPCTALTHFENSTLSKAPYRIAGTTRGMHARYILHSVRHQRPQGAQEEHTRKRGKQKSVLRDPYGSNDPNKGVFGPTYYVVDGIGALKPYYLGPIYPYIVPLYPNFYPPITLLKAP